jgi:RNA polymerase subunit RPABC4/transcription elongation factor Spt4
MTDSVEPTRECPSCGQTITSGEMSCPQCGKEITNISKKLGKAKGKTAKATKVECPYCCELISKRSKKCPSCRTSLTAGWYNVSIQNVDKETSEPKTDLNTQMVQVTAYETTPSLSSGCQVVPGESDPGHQTCETTPEGGMQTTEPIVSVNPPPAREPPEMVEGQDKKSDLAAPIESIPVKESPGTVEDEMRSGEPIAPVDFQSVEELPEKIEDPKGTAELLTLAGSIPMEEVPSTIVEEKKTAGIVTPVDFTLAKESRETGNVAEVGDSQLCRECEAIVLKSSQESLVCIASSVETAPHVEQAQPTAEPLKTQPQGESNVPIGGTEAKPVRLIRRRKLKSAKSTPAPAVAPTNDIGSPKGVGNVSGLG